MCTPFQCALSGYGPDETVDIEVSYFTDPGVYKKEYWTVTNADGKGTFTWPADVTTAGQYILWGRSPSAVGSAVIIVEDVNNCP